MRYGAVSVDAKRDRVAKVASRMREVLVAGLDDDLHKTYAKGFLRRVDHIEEKLPSANGDSIEILIRDLSHVIDGWAIRRSDTTTPLAMRGLHKKLYGEF